MIQPANIPSGKKKAPVRKKRVTVPRPKRAKVGSKKLRLVVTAGPTREHIDPVRYLSNESSGKMGFAIAQAAQARGHRVTLIAGPVALATPKGVKRLDVVSARDMLAAMKLAFADAHGLLMAAAVADYRPARRMAGKWKKKPGAAHKGVSLDLVENPDLLATVCKRKGQRRVIGFALETADGRRRALEKMMRKNTDAIALNGASALNANRTSLTLFQRDGTTVDFEDKTKTQIARGLVRAMESMCQGQ